MTKQEIQLLAKLVQKIVQTEIAKSHKKLISEISTLKKSGMPLNEVIARTNTSTATSVSPSLDFLREMVGGPLPPDQFYDDDLPPTVSPNDPTNAFIKDYSQTLKKIDESTANRHNLQQQ